MDRTGKIALSAIGAVAGLVVIVGCSDGTAPVKPRSTATVTETASPKFEVPKLKPLTWSNGDYIIGDDIPYGTYTSAGAKDDVFDLCIVSSTSSVDGHWPILKTANADDRIIVQVTARNRGDVLSITGCTPFEKRS